jgi:hypothetical protein
MTKALGGIEFQPACRDRRVSPPLLIDTRPKGGAHSSHFSISVQVFAAQSLNAVFAKNHNFLKHSFKNQLTIEYGRCNVRLMNNEIKSEL